MRTDYDEVDGGPALFRLVRFWSRRWVNEAAETADGEVGVILLLEALDAAAPASGPASIVDVAAQLGLDRSNASRMLANAVAGGYVTKTLDDGDGRRSQLTVTADGRALLAAARQWQQQVFAELTADWPSRDAERFAGYLVRLADQTLPTRRDAGAQS